MINIPDNKHVNPNLVHKDKNAAGHPAKMNNNSAHISQMSTAGGHPGHIPKTGKCPFGHDQKPSQETVVVKQTASDFGPKILPKPVQPDPAAQKPSMMAMLAGANNQPTGGHPAHIKKEGATGAVHPHAKRLMEQQQPVKEADSVEQVIAELNNEEKFLMIGQKSADPLHEAFPRKRVVHPGASGTMLPPPAQQPAWNHYMSFATEVGNRRAAYVHIPFCSQKCLYCGFFQNFSDDDLETYYVNHLVKQIEMARNYNYLQTSPVNAIFFGGGTPSALSPKNAARVLQALRSSLPLANDCEITMETTVHDLTEDKLEAWFANGVNRISIGVQSFDTKVRKTMGRKDPREVVIDNIKRAASYNQAVIIVDLIYGLPYQTVENFLDDLRTINELPIDGMDLYQLNIFENSALKQAIDNGTIPPAATTKEQGDYLAAAVVFLKDLGYRRVSMCHWAKSNRERSLYNNLAKSNAEVIPFGSGAGGFVKDISMFIHRDLQTYNQLVDEGKWPMMVMMQEPANKALYKDLQAQTEQLHIDLNKLAQTYNEPRVLKLESLMEIWLDYGLITKGKQMYHLTMAGQFWQNNMTQTMIEILERLLAGKKSLSLQPIAAQG